MRILWLHMCESIWWVWSPAQIQGATVMIIYWEHCLGRTVPSRIPMRASSPASICDTLEATWAQGQFLTLAPLGSNGVNQRSMWIFSKKIIQKEYPGRGGEGWKALQDPTGRRSPCLEALGGSENSHLSSRSSKGCFLVEPCYISVLLGARSGLHHLTSV